MEQNKGLSNGDLKPEHKNNAANTMMGPTAGIYSQAAQAFKWALLFPTFCS